MIRKLLLTIGVLLLSACSLSTPQNEWQYKSADAFKNYTREFMYTNDSLAKHYLSRAIKEAKMSADLTTLARVYLGKCALNISVGLEDSCKEYQTISNLVEDEQLSTYYEIITSSTSLDPEIILDKERDLSILLHGALIKEDLNSAEREELLQIASHNGYKRAVLFWLEQSRLSCEDEKKAFYRQKIEALK